MAKLYPSRTKTRSLTASGWARIRCETASDVVLGSVVALTVVLLSFNDGGQGSQTWGWAAAAGAIVAALAFGIRPRIPLSMPLLVAVAAMTLWLTWECVSLWWTTDLASGVSDVQRDIVYATALLSATALKTHNTGAVIRHALAAAGASVCLWSGITHLFPATFGYHNSDPEGLGRLYYPLGYWNAQGVFAAVTLVLLLGIACGRGRLVWRGVAGAVLPVVGVDGYFTLSRGALAAAAVAVIAMLVVDDDRVRSSFWVILEMAFVGLALALAYREPSLVGAAFGHHSLAAGRSVARSLVGVSLASGTATIAGPTLEQKVHVGRAVKLAYIVAASVVAIGLGTVALHRSGGPTAVIASVTRGLDAPPPTAPGSARLLSLSLNDRNAIWNVAWRDVQAHPVAGSGAGSYGQRWIAARPIDFSTQWAHSLYLQTAAELGGAGVLILLSLLALPLIWWWRVRSAVGISAVVGGYAAFLAHSAVDWDWAVPALTVTGLWCGFAVLATDRRIASVPLSRAWRGALILGTCLVAVVAVLGYVGNRYLSESLAAGEAGRIGAAASYGRAASHWQPWSDRPWIAIGKAELKGREIGRARDAFREAVSRDSTDWVAWLGLAETLSGRARVAAFMHARLLNLRGGPIWRYCKRHPGPACNNLPPRR